LGDASSIPPVELPPFPVDSLSDWLRAFAQAEATATQTQVDLAAMLGLSVVSAACARKVVVQVKPGYREPANIYTVTTLPSGSRKTAVFADATAPLEEYERSEAKRTPERLPKPGQLTKSGKRGFGGYRSTQPALKKRAGIDSQGKPRR